MALKTYRNRFPRLVDMLLRAGISGRLGHAYLLLGDDPDLLEQLAMAWLSTRACTTPRPDGDACETCPACRQFQHGNFPDLTVVRPKSRSRRILTEDIRSLDHQLGLTSTTGRFKAGLILEADRMQEQAQNAFLKTLEEPDPGTLLVLTTVRPRQVLPTIRSRCQIVSLQQNVTDYTPALEAGLFRVLADLRPAAGAASALAAATRLSDLFKSLHQQAEEMVSEGLGDQWESVAADDPKLRKDLEEQRKAHVEAEYVRLRQEMLDAVQTWFGQQTLLAAGIPASRLPHPEILPEKGEEAKPFSLDDAERCNALSAELLRFLAGNVNERLALEAFCLSVCKK